MQVCENCGKRDNIHHVKSMSPRGAYLCSTCLSAFKLGWDSMALLKGVK